MNRSELISQPFLTASEIAERLQCARSTVIRKINRGEFVLPDGSPGAYVEASEWRVVTQAFEHYLSQIKIAPPQRAPRTVKEPDSGYITTETASELSGYHVVYIRKLIRAGEITAKKYGAAYQVNRQSLEDYLAAAHKSADGRYGAKPGIRARDRQVGGDDLQ